MATTYLCYFMGGDAGDRFERIERQATDAGLLNGDPAHGVLRGPNRSVYRRTNRTIRSGGQLWTVWEHCGDWVPYSEPRRLGSSHQ